MLKLKTSLLSLILLPCTSFATVGGPQNIEILGYDHQDQKVYLLKHYEDGRGRLPQLYYYQFKNNQHPEKLIQVNSLYINPKTQKIEKKTTFFKTPLGAARKRIPSCPLEQKCYFFVEAILPAKSRVSVPSSIRMATKGRLTSMSLG